MFCGSCIGRCRALLNTPWTMPQQHNPTTWHQDVGDASDAIKQSPDAQSIPRVSIFGRSVVSYTAYCISLDEFKNIEPSKKTPTAMAKVGETFPQRKIIESTSFEDAWL